MSRRRRRSRRIPPGTEVQAGAAALAELGTVADVCVNGVVKFAGLRLTLATLAAGKRLALANKESLIAGGPVVRSVLARPGAGHIVLVDSSTGGAPVLASSPRGDAKAGMRTFSRPAAAVPGPQPPSCPGSPPSRTPLPTPTWSMGPKITADSSTLMNKGLEVIEAHELLGDDYGIDYDHIDVVVHPQSIVH